MVMKGPPNIRKSDDDDEDFKQAKIRALKGRAMPKGIKEGSGGRFGPAPSNREKPQFGSAKMPANFRQTENRPIPQGIKNRVMPKGIKGASPKAPSKTQEEDVVENRKKSTY